MNQELHNFIKDYVTLLQEKHAQSLLQIEKCEIEADEVFHQGASFAYYDALDLLKSQLESFGYNSDFELIVPELGKPIEQPGCVNPY